MGKQINFKFGISVCMECFSNFEKKKVKQTLCKNCKSIKMKIYMKEYLKNYYLKNRVLKGRGIIKLSPINCERCGISTERTSSNQKSCIDCRPIIQYKRRLDKFNFKYNNDESFRLKVRKWNAPNVKKSYEKHLVRNRIKRRASENSRRAIGKIQIEDIQNLYESNIKKYGTLTCYLCLKPVGFTRDSIEHKIPICLGGDNQISNLEVAHLSCNIRKGKKLLKEGCFK